MKDDLSRVFESLSCVERDSYYTMAQLTELQKDTASMRNDFYDIREQIATKPGFHDIECLLDCAKEQIITEVYERILGQLGECVMDREHDVSDKEFLTNIERLVLSCKN